MNMPAALNPARCTARTARAAHNDDTELWTRAEVEAMLAAERERIAQHFDARDTGKDGKPLGIGFYDPHEPAEIIRALGPA